MNLKNYSYAHTDLFSYFSHILNNNKTTLKKTLELMIQDLLIIAKKKIIIPTYNYNFTKNGIYNYYQDKSEVGNFSEYFRNLYKENRTMNPVYSDCSAQKINKIIKPLNPFVKGSTFDLLSKNNGNIITFGAEFAPSYIMYLENCIPNGPRYRFLKSFKGVIIKNKKKKNVEIQFYCRPLNIYFKYDLNKIKKDLINEKILKTCLTGNGFKYTSFSAKKFKEFALSKIKKNDFYFLDKKTEFIIKKYLKKKYRVSLLDFENYV